MSTHRSYTGAIFNVPTCRCGCLCSILICSGAIAPDHLLSLSSLGSMSRRFGDDCTGLNIGSLSLSALADCYFSSFNGGPICHSLVIGRVATLLRSCTGRCRLRNGTTCTCALPCLAHVASIPLSSDRCSFFSRSIPFCSVIVRNCTTLMNNGVGHDCSMSRSLLGSMRANDRLHCVNVCASSTVLGSASSASCCDAACAL